jgi:hypothetical protein
MLIVEELRFDMSETCPKGGWKRAEDAVRHLTKCINGIYDCIGSHKSRFNVAIGLSISDKLESVLEDMCDADERRRLGHEALAHHRFGLLGE